MTEATLLVLLPHVSDMGLHVSCFHGSLDLTIDILLLTALQYYLKTGTCKFGATCKFHHPRDKAGIAGRVSLNILGYPLRPVRISFFSFNSLQYNDTLCQYSGLFLFHFCLFHCLYKKKVQSFDWVSLAKRGNWYHPV